MNSKEPPWRYSSPNWLYYYVIRGDRQMVHSVTCQEFFFFFFCASLPPKLFLSRWSVKQTILWLKPSVTSSWDIALDEIFFIENIKNIPKAPKWKQRADPIFWMSNQSECAHTHTHTHTYTLYITSKGSVMWKTIPQSKICYFIFFSTTIWWPLDFQVEMQCVKL